MGYQEEGRRIWSTLAGGTQFIGSSQCFLPVIIRFDHNWKHEKFY